MAVTVLIYGQLFLEWAALGLATLSLTLVPYAADFYGILPMGTKTTPLIAFGLWVLVEIGLFFILLVVATAIMCSCHHVPHGVGFIHLMVDPALLAVAGVPFLLIRGLPTASAIYRCDLLHSCTNTTVIPPGDCKAYIMPLLTLLKDATAGLESGGPKRCTDNNLLEMWITSMQCGVVAPVVIRCLRYRWKMSLQPFIQSGLYLFVQALDITSMVNLAVYETDNPNFRMGLEIIVYVTALLLVVACLALCTAPMYIGNHVTNNYLVKIMTIGAAAVDFPFVIARISAVIQLSNLETVQALFYIMMLKNALSVLVLVGQTLVKCYCRKTAYITIPRQGIDHDDEHFGEDFV